MRGPWVVFGVVVAGVGLGDSLSRKVLVYLRANLVPGLGGLVSLSIRSSVSWLQFGAGRKWAFHLRVGWVVEVSWLRSSGDSSVNRSSYGVHGDSCRARP